MLAEFPVATAGYPACRGASSTMKKLATLACLANVAEDGSDEFSRQASLRAAAEEAFAEGDAGSGPRARRYGRQRP